MKKGKAKKRTPHKQFTSALRTVIRRLGGQHRVLLALGWVPAEEPGEWHPPGNREITFRQKAAIGTAFFVVKWLDAGGCHEEERRLAGHPDPQWSRDRMKK